jgi:hypothetical protein
MTGRTAELETGQMRHNNQDRRVRIGQLVQTTGEDNGARTESKGQNMTIRIAEQKTGQLGQGSWDWTSGKE